MRDQPPAYSLVEDCRRLFSDVLPDVGENPDSNRRYDDDQRPEREQFAEPLSTVVNLGRGGGWSCHDAAAAFGKLTMTLVPLLGRDCNAISAPCSRAIQLAID